jgi:hypothetical protein
MREGPGRAKGVSLRWKHVCRSEGLRILCVTVEEGETLTKGRL